jgi:hypothetical protein
VYSGRNFRTFQKYFCLYLKNQKGIQAYKKKASNKYLKRREIDWLNIACLDYSLILEDRGSTLLQNIGQFLPDYSLSQKIYHSSQPPQ